MLSSEELLIEQLRDLREQLHLSQEQVAQLIGVSFSTLNRWENGHLQPGRRSRAQLEKWIQEARQPAEPQAAAPRQPRLPGGTASFVGRAAELAELAALWPGCRMLTLTGAGGIGKTRLAAELLRRHSDEVLGAVPLDAVSDPALAVAEIGAALGVRARARAAEPMAIVAALRERFGVLFLDTCERCATELRPLARALLEEAPGIRVLATSRIPLEVAGEQVWRVRGLRLPGGASAGQAQPPGAAAQHVTGGDAVELFVTRAQERVQGFAPDHAALADIAQVCGRLDGMPLALELAAAWMGASSPGELLRRWNEHADMLSNPAAEQARHRTMLATMQWSADLLGPGDRELVSSLAVFTGPFTSADAQAVSGAPGGAGLMQGLRRLTAACWLEFSHGPPEYYQMLGPLRDWASLELGRSDRAEAINRRHAAHVRDVCAQAEADRFRVGPDDDWPQRLELLDGSIQAALDRCSRLDGETGAQIAVSLLGWWRLSGRLTQGRHWLGTLSQAGLPALARARTQCSAALLAMDAGDYGEVARLAQLALPVLDEHGDSRWHGRALTALSSAAKYRGNIAGARHYLEQALQLQSASADQHELAATLNNLGSLAADAKNLREAERYYQLSLRAKHGSIDRSVALTMANLADIATQRGRLAEARGLLDDAMAIVERLDDTFLRAFININLGENLLSARDYAGALTPFRAALAYAVRADAGRFRLLATCGLGQALCGAGKESDGKRLLQECRRAAEQAGDEMIARQAVGALLLASGSERHPQPGLLTRREEQIMEQVYDGLSNHDIALALSISDPTVQRHLSNIFRKLEVRNRTAAARKWDALSRQAPPGESGRRAARP